MLTPFLLLPCILAAAPPGAPQRKPAMIHLTLEASVTFGPGREPPPGTPPFQPKLDLALGFQDPPPRGTTFRLWLLPSAAPASTPAGSVRGRRALPFEILSREGQAASLRANWPQGLGAEAWQAAVECLVGGKVRGSARAPVRAHYLPSAPPRGRQEADN